MSDCSQSDDVDISDFSLAPIVTPRALLHGQTPYDEVGQPPHIPMRHTDLIPWAGFGYSALPSLSYLVTEVARCPRLAKGVRSNGLESTPCTGVYFGEAAHLVLPSIALVGSTQLIEKLDQAHGTIEEMSGS